MKPVIGITMGDFNGIGPEIALKAVRSRQVREKCDPVLIGSIDAFAWYARHLRMNVTFRETEEVQHIHSGKTIPVINIRKFHTPIIHPGKISGETGSFAGDSIAAAVALCSSGALDAMVTSPVSKKAMDLGGFHYPGQTEMLLKWSKSKRVLMILLSGTFRVGLVTVHVPITSVPRELTREKILEKLSTLHDSLKVDFAIKKPRIAVLGLNPHAGEDGLIGTEETRIILPALRTAHRKGIPVDGPFPADGFFGVQGHRQYDAILAMYHDQGLIPLKMEGFETGVNYSAGLRIVRTSPDHGTAFDIAGKGIANEQSMISAILLAVTIAKNRKSKERHG
jgi:4-hydroxythreonine-4-phosphate dehydrogenase